MLCEIFNSGNRRKVIRIWATLILYGTELCEASKRTFYGLPLSFGANSFFKPNVIFHYALQLCHKVSSPLVFLLTWVTLEIRALCLRCTFHVIFTNFTILHFALNLDGKGGGGGGWLFPPSPPTWFATLQ
jgi:hypothetical protein